MRRQMWGATLVVVALGAAPVMPASQAAPAPKTTKYFLHIHIVQPGVENAEYDFFMDTRDYPDRGDGTGNTGNGLPNEVFGATGIEEVRRDVFPARERLPLRLDASRPVTGRIGVEAFEVTSLGYGAPVGAGQVVLEADLVGTPSGTEDPVVIGQQTIEFLVTPVQPEHLLEIRLEPDPALDGTRFEEIALTTHFRGASLLTGFFELDDPASFIEIPTLRARRT